VIHLAGVHIRTVVDLGGAVEVDRAVADLRVWIRHVADHLQRNRVEAAARDGVVREGLTARASSRIASQRVVDHDETTGAVEGLGKVTRLLARRGHAQCAIARGARTVTLGCKPEERLVLHDRPADATATGVEIRVGNGHVGERREEVVRHAPLRAGLVETAAVPVVAARLGRDVERAAARASRLRVVLVHLHVHAFDRFDSGIGRRAVAHVGDRHAVNEVVVAAPRAAAQREQRGVGLILLTVELGVTRGDDRGHRHRKQERGTAAARKRLELLRVDHRASGGIGRIDERRIAGDRDRFLQLADIELDVQRHELLGADADALVLEFLEARQFRRDGVDTGVHRRKVILAAFVGDRITARAVVLAEQRDGHAGDHAA